MTDSQDDGIESYRDLVCWGSVGPLLLNLTIPIRISRHMLGEHLDGDGAVQSGVGGLVDLDHAVCAEILE